MEYNRIFLEQNGEKKPMPAFCGQDLCQLDANGRVKLSPRLLADFAGVCSGEVVLHCLPEGAIGIYPPEVFAKMKANSTDPSNAGESLLRRRMLRRFGAFSEDAKISPQGRITVPPAFREHGGLQPGAEIYIIGVEIGAEIWSRDAWLAERELLKEHWAARGEAEMAGDIANLRG